ncbi:MAG: hypothetical protein RIR37_1184 [Verrucomicrobiota bacterium]|jgi:hypothetical protein
MDKKFFVGSWGWTITIFKNDCGVALGAYSYCGIPYYIYLV